MRGNVVDMAVGIIIGGAFGKIVSSVVADIIMPPVGFAHRRSEFLRPENHIERGSHEGRGRGDAGRHAELR